MQLIILQHNATNRGGERGGGEAQEEKEEKAS